MPKVDLIPILEFLWIQVSGLCGSFFILFLKRKVGQIRFNELVDLLLQFFLIFCLIQYLVFEDEGIVRFLVSEQLREIGPELKEHLPFHF